MQAIVRGLTHEIPVVRDMVSKQSVSLLPNPIAHSSFDRGAASRTSRGGVFYALNISSRSFSSTPDMSPKRTKESDKLDEVPTMVVNVRKVPVRTPVSDEIADVVREAYKKHVDKKKELQVYKDLKESINPTAKRVASEQKMIIGDPGSDVIAQGRIMADGAYVDRYKIKSSMIPSLELTTGLNFGGKDGVYMNCLYLAFENLHDKFWSHLPGVITDVCPSPDLSRAEIEASIPKDKVLEFGRLAVDKELRGSGVVQDFISHSLRIAMALEGTGQLVCVCANNVQEKLIAQNFDIKPLSARVDQVLDSNPRKLGELRHRLKQDVGFPDKYIDFFVDRYLKTQRVKVVVITLPSLHEKLRSVQHTTSVPQTDLEKFFQTQRLVRVQPPVQIDISSDILSKLRQSRKQSDFNVSLGQDLKAARDLYRAIGKALEVHDSTALTHHNDVFGSELKEKVLSDQVWNAVNHFLNDSTQPS